MGSHQVPTITLQEGCLKGNIPDGVIPVFWNGLSLSLVVRSGAVPATLSATHLFCGTFSEKPVPVDEVKGFQTKHGLRFCIYFISDITGWISDKQTSHLIILPMLTG